jgi:hypothetical protein
MREIVIWALLAVVLGGLADRALLRMEAEGWINYRRHGLSRGGAAYHMRELQSIYDPGIRYVIEAHVREPRRDDESGDPLRHSTDT